MNNITVSYTIDDDGIHLDCECGWSSVGIGYSPTVNEVVAKAAEHRAEHWKAELPVAMLSWDVFVRVLRETASDLVVRVDEIVADIERTADARADEVVSAVLSDADEKGGTDGA